MTLSVHPQDRRWQVPDPLADEVDEAIESVPVEQRVHEQVAALEGIEGAPVAEHAQRYDEVHAALQAALVEIDGESG